MHLYSHHRDDQEIGLIGAGRPGLLLQGVALQHEKSDEYGNGNHSDDCLDDQNDHQQAPPLRPRDRELVEVDDIALPALAVLSCGRRRALTGGCLQLQRLGEGPTSPLNSPLGTLYVLGHAAIVRPKVVRTEGSPLDTSVTFESTARQVLTC